MLQSYFTEVSQCYALLHVGSLYILKMWFMTYTYPNLGQGKTKIWRITWTPRKKYDIFNHVIVRVLSFQFGTQFSFRSSFHKWKLWKLVLLYFSLLHILTHTSSSVQKTQTITIDPVCQSWSCESGGSILTVPEGCTCRGVVLSPQVVTMWQTNVNHNKHKHERHGIVSCVVGNWRTHVESVFLRVLAGSHRGATDQGSRPEQGTVCCFYCHSKFTVVHSTRLFSLKNVYEWLSST